VLTPLLISAGIGSVFWSVAKRYVFVTI
jgi:hypothetical protein